ncbi:MAG: carbohydrate kinase family protein [Kiritimatiellae bacterium]|nr:carbohydrate kinase family protein [Kiritimatiellia bacterium]
MGIQPKVVGLGCGTLDILIRAEQLPTWEHNTRFEAISFDGGGQAATAMAAVSRLGIPAGFIGTAGNDNAADLKLRLTERYGVDLSRIAHRNSPDDAVVIVFVDAKTGERMFFGGGRQGEVPLHTDEMDREYITAADYLHLDGLHVEAAREAAQWMHAAGKTVVLDPGTSQGKVWKDHLTLLPHVDVLIGGSGFGQALSGQKDIRQAGAKAIEMGPRIFVQTEGNKGCYTITPEDSFHTPAFPVDVVDTTGAGDVFHGAYIVGLAHGWDLRRTAQFASAVSAIKCTRIGGRAGIPTFDEALAFLHTRGIDPDNGKHAHTAER